MNRKLFLRKAMNNTKPPHSVVVCYFCASGVISDAAREKPGYLERVIRVSCSDVQQPVVFYYGRLPALCTNLI